MSGAGITIKGDGLMSPLKRQVLWMLFVPYGAFLVLFLLLVGGQIREVGEARDFEAYLGTVDPALTAFSGALEEEYLATAEVLGGYDDARSRLASAREKVDAARAELTDFELPGVIRGDGYLAARFAALLDGVQGLEELRAAIDGGNIGRGPALRQFETVFGDIVAFASRLPRYAPDLEQATLSQAVVDAMTVHRRFLEEAAYGRLLFAGTAFDAESYARFVAARSMAEAARARLMEEIDPQTAAALRSSGSEEDRAALLRLEERLAKLADGIRMDGGESARWLQVTRATLGDLATFDHGLIVQLVEKAGDTVTRSIILVLASLLAVLGLMFVSLLLLRRGFAAIDRLQQAEEEARAEAEEHRRRTAREIADRFENEVGTIVRRLRQRVAELAKTTHMVEENVGSARAEGAQANEAAARVHANTQSVAAAVEEFSEAAQEIASQIARSSEFARDANQQVSDASHAVEELATLADRIGSVVTTIADIAEQTNLLALNATIEAARAGEAGKGFAVVAQEVKSLASQTANATQDVRHQVEEVRRTSGSVVGAIHRVQAAMGELDQVAATVASAVEEQNAVISDVAQNTRETAAAASHITDRVEQLHDRIGVSGEAAHRMRNEAEKCDAEVEDLDRRVSDFLSEVRSA